VLSLSQRLGDGLSTPVSTVAVRTRDKRHSHLQDLLILLCLFLVDLLHRTDVFLEVAHGVFPCLQSLGEQAGGLSDAGCQQCHGVPCCGRTVQHTLLGSVSGTASSLRMLEFVACRKGISVVAPDMASALAARSQERELGYYCVIIPATTEESWAPCKVGREQIKILYRNVAM